MLQRKLSQNIWNAKKLPFWNGGNCCIKWWWGEIAPYPHIGIDESGKGDFFGPLVIAGVLLDENGAKTLQEAGVCDSKKMNDKKILELQNLIKEVSVFDIIAISPSKYNELYSKFKNLNKITCLGGILPF